MTIDLRHPLTLRNSLRFPLQSPAARRDVLIGGLWLLVPVLGWHLNMGHRVRVVHRMHAGQTPWPAWERPGELLKHGALTFLGMAWYGWPGVSLIALGAWLESGWLLALGGLLWLLAVIAIPGYMSHYCKRYDPREIFDPLRALRRVGGSRGQTVDPYSELGQLHRHRPGEVQQPPLAGAVANVPRLSLMSRRGDYVNHIALPPLVYHRLGHVLGEEKRPGEDNVQLASPLV